MRRDGEYDSVSFTDRLREQVDKSYLLKEDLTIAAIAAAIGAAVTIIFSMLGARFTHGGSEFYAVVLSSILAVIGVSITGYIFLIEYIRRLKTDRPIYKDVSDRFREKIFNSLRLLSWFGVYVGFVCVAMLVIRDDGWPQGLEVTVAAIVMATFFAFLYEMIRIDMSMMHVEGEIGKLVEKYRRIACDIIRHDTDLLVRLNSEEYESITHSTEFVSGIPEVDRDGRCDVITFIRGSDTENMRIKVGDNLVRNTANIVGYRDNRDEYDVRNVLNIFSDVELLLCRAMGLDCDTVPENVSISTNLSSTNAQSNEIGIANDIELYYERLRKYRDYYFLMDEWSKRDRDKGDEGGIDKLAHASIGEDCTMSGPWFLFGRVAKDSDMVDDISFEAWREELGVITPLVFLLRYELSKKLAMKNVSNISLPGYDFSYADMNNTSINDSYLAGVSFFNTDLSSANLSNCNLRGADFKHAKCEGTNLRGSDLYISSFAHSEMSGAILAEANISNCLFPQIPISNCDAHRALILMCRFVDSNISGSSFLDAAFNNTKINYCSVLSCNFKHSSITDCVIEDSSFNGSLFMGSSINRSSLIKSTFINTKMSDCEMSALMILRTNFSNSEMQNINFTETQILAAKFKSSRLDNSLFNKASIGPYHLPPEDKTILKLDYEQRERIMVYAKPFEDKGIMDKDIDTRLDIENRIAMFDHASLRKCHFIETNISCASMCFSILEQVEFNKATISYASFESSDMQKAVIINSRLSDCNLNNISFNDSSLTDVHIKDCTMFNCNMARASLSNVVLEDVNLENTSMSHTRIVGCTFRNVNGLDYHLLKDADVIYNVQFVNCYDADGNKVPDQRVVDSKKFLEELKNLENA